MFDLKLEWTVGVEGRGWARKRLWEEAVEKLNTLWLVAHRFIPGKEQVTNQNKSN